METQPLLSLCMICQDEEECVARVLDNVREYVDEIVIFDSGSTDKTLEIIESYRRQEGTPIYLHHHPLENDFAAQRNRCIAEAKGEWILILDFDETLDKDALTSLRRLCENDFHDVYAFNRRTRIDGRLYNVFDFDFHPRLFRNNGVIKYNGKIHESLVGHQQMQLCNMTVNHDKKRAWQIKDDKRLWDMGQTPPPGWTKVDGKWVYKYSVFEEPHYLYPEKSFWKMNDKRVSINAFDEETFRKWYNDCMPNEQPPLEENQLGLCKKEIMIVDILKSQYSNGRMLTIGCGNGKFITAVLKMGIISEAVGMDISDEMVEAAKKTAINNGVQVPFYRSSIENFTLDKQFEVVVAFDVLEHIFTLRDVLFRIRNEFLVTGGMLCGSVPWLRTCDSSTHLHYFTEDSLRNLLNQVYRDVTVEKIDLTGGPEYHIVFTGIK